MSICLHIKSGYYTSKELKAQMIDLKNQYWIIKMQAHLENHIIPTVHYDLSV